MRKKLNNFFYEATRLMQQKKIPHTITVFFPEEGASYQYTYCPLEEKLIDPANEPLDLEYALEHQDAEIDSVRRARKDFWHD